MKNRMNKSRLVRTAFLVAVALSSVPSVNLAQEFMENCESYEVGSDVLGQGGYGEFLAANIILNDLLDKRQKLISH